MGYTVRFFLKRANNYDRMELIEQRCWEAKQRKQIIDYSVHQDPVADTAIYEIVYPE